jgi:hypothetical protein
LIQEVAHSNARIFFCSFLLPCESTVEVLQPHESSNEGYGIWLSLDLRRPVRRGARVADWARLEIVCTFTGTEGSNPSLSVSGDS